MNKRTRIIVLLLCGVMVTVCWGNSVWIIAKAQLGQYLIQRAWEKNLAGEVRSKPWPWADTWPVAQLDFPQQQRRLVVLAGGQGASLAFGPGLLEGTMLPGDVGTKVIGGHRDTHFRFLKHAAVGDEFRLQDRSGAWQRYRIVQLKIVDSREGLWRFDPSKHEVHLITCYPFDSANPGGPLRYVAIAQNV